MEPKEIAEKLGIDESKVLIILNPKKLISSLKTAKEAKELYEKCPSEMKPAVMEKWNEIVKIAIPKLQTADEARRFYVDCHSEMKPAVMEKWNEIVKIAIPKLQTADESKELYEKCPSEMEPAVIKKMAGL